MSNRLKTVFNAYLLEENEQCTDYLRSFKMRALTSQGFTRGLGLFINYDIKKDRSLLEDADS